MTVDLAHLSLALSPGIGPARLPRLLRAFGSAQGVLEASYEALCAIEGLSRPAATAIRKIDIASTERIVLRTEALGGQVLVPADESFPARLRAIPDPPLVLFGLGNVALLSLESVAIVGSRDHTRYGREVCRHIAGGTARAGLGVVSGMARGLDAVAHEAALDAGGATVGVLGNGLGIVYPSANRALYDRMAAHGCLITEFPPGERPHAGSFPRRNRLISGLARVTAVIEAGERSGTMLTVDAALAQGREVLVVPGPITSPRSTGCNRLLQQGAKPLLGLRDVLEEYGLSHESSPRLMPVGASDAERRVLEELDRGTEVVDDIAARLDVPVADVLAVVTTLEIKGLAVTEAGNVVRKKVGE